MQKDLHWYYYSTNYDDEESIYYKKNGCNCNAHWQCCFNTNFPVSYEVEQNFYLKKYIYQGK